MKVKVRVLPGTVLSDNHKSWHPGDELEMDLVEANRRVSQGRVERIGPAVGSSVAEAIDAVKAAATLDALAGLKEGESRKTVLAAIEAREKELA